MYAMLSRFGLALPLQQVIDKCPEEVFSDNKGMRIEVLQDVLKAFSMAGEVLEGEYGAVVPRALRQGYAMVIPNTADKHFYILFAQKDDRILCLNPPLKTSWISTDEAKGLYQGVGVVVAPESWPAYRVAQSPPVSGNLWGLLGALSIIAGFVMLLLRRKSTRVAAMCLAAVGYLGMPAYSATSNPVPADNEVMISRDIGIVSPDTEYTQIFKVKNPFKTTFKVGRIMNNCSCISLEMPNKEIPPGQESDVVMTVKTKPDVAGAVEVVSTLVDQSVPPRFIHLTMTGRANDDARLISSMQTINLGRVDASSGALEMTFYVERMDRSQLMFKSIRVSGPAMEGRAVVPPGLAQSVIRTYVHLKVYANRLRPGQVNEWVEVETESKDHGILRIPVTGEIIGDIEAAPKRLFLGEVSGLPGPWSVRVESKSQRPIRVINASHSLGKEWGLVISGLSVDLRPASMPAPRPGIIHGDIKVEVEIGDRQGRADLVIPVEGTIERERSSRHERPTDKVVYEIESLNNEIRILRAVKISNGAALVDMTIETMPSTGSRQVERSAEFRLESTSDWTVSPVGLAVTPGGSRQWWILAPRSDKNRASTEMPIRVCAFNIGKAQMERAQKGLAVSETILASIGIPEGSPGDAQVEALSLHEQALAAERTGREVRLQIRPEKASNGTYRAREFKPSEISTEQYGQEIQAMTQLPNAGNKN